MKSIFLLIFFTFSCNYSIGTSEECSSYKHVELRNDQCVAVYGTLVGIKTYETSEICDSPTVTTCFSFRSTQKFGKIKVYYTDDSIAVLNSCQCDENLKALMQTKQEDNYAKN
jgi:hypothetical protein